MKYIDLGLPSGTLWADRNVGAEKPKDYGDYFNFDDAQKCGTLPARWQMCELVNYTKKEVCEVDNVDGMRFKGENGNSIFMPFAGCMYYSDSNLYDVSNNGNWWSCTPKGDYAYYLDLSNSGDVGPSSYGYRALGLSIRLIKNKLPCR